MLLLVTCPNSLPGQPCSTKLNSNPKYSREAPQTYNLSYQISNRHIMRKQKIQWYDCHVLLTSIGELKALVSVRPIGVKFQPQVVRRAVEKQPQHLVLSEGPQWAWRAILPIVYLGRVHRMRPPSIHVFILAIVNKESKSFKMWFYTVL